MLWIWSTYMKIDMRYIKQQVQFYSNNSTHINFCHITYFNVIQELLVADQSKAMFSPQHEYSLAATYTYFLGLGFKAAFTNTSPLLRRPALRWEKSVRISLAGLWLNDKRVSQHELDLNLQRSFQRETTLKTSGRFGVSHAPSSRFTRWGLWFHT